MSSRLVGVVGDPQDPAVQVTASMLAVMSEGLWVPGDLPVRFAVSCMLAPFIAEAPDPYRGRFDNVTLADHVTTLEETKALLQQWGDDKLPGLWRGMMKASLEHDLSCHPCVVVCGVETQEQADLVEELGGDLLQVLSADPLGTLPLLPPKGHSVVYSGDQFDLEYQLKDFLSE